MAGFLAVILVQAFLYNLSMYIRREAELVFLFGNLTDILIIYFLCGSKFFTFHSSLFTLKFLLYLDLSEGLDDIADLDVVEVDE